MGLHRLTSITLGVPDVAASSMFCDEFGLDAGTDGWFGTRDGGQQLQLVSTPHRSLQRLGVGAGDADDLARLAARVDSVGLGTIVESSPDRLTFAEPVSGLQVEVTVATETLGPRGWEPGEHTA